MSAYGLLVTIEVEVSSYGKRLEVQTRLHLRSFIGRRSFYKRNIRGCLMLSIYKCLKNRVAGIDNCTPYKMMVLSAILKNYKCDLMRHIYNYLC